MIAVTTPAPSAEPGPLHLGPNPAIVVVTQLIDVGYDVIEGEPKTRRGRRRIALDAPTADMLREHRDRQRNLGGADVSRGFVFTKPDGTPLHPDFVTNHFDHLVRRRRRRVQRRVAGKPQVRPGAPPGTRTPNPRIKSPLLCQLS